MKIEIEIQSELGDEIMQAGLIQSYSLITSGYFLKEKIPLFSYDQKEEQKQIKKLAKAFKLVMDYYGVDAATIKNTEIGINYGD
jgi:hypothetical protein